MRRQAPVTMALVLTSLVAACSRPTAPPPLSRYARLAAVEARDRAALLQLRKVGATVEPWRGGTAVTMHDADTPTADAAVAAARDLMDLASFSLIDSQPSAGWVTKLRREPHLRHIALSGVRLSTVDVIALRRLPNLQSLHLVNCGTTDADLANLAQNGAKIEELTIAQAPVTDDGSSSLSELDNLHTLRLIETGISGQQVMRLLIDNPWLVVELGDEGGEVKGGWAVR